VLRATFDSRGAISTGYFAREIGTEAGLVLKGGRARSDKQGDMEMTNDKAQMPDQAQNPNGKSRGRGLEAVIGD
jgi:hypothetical protein